jgi:hypothetical protein
MEGITGDTCGVSGRGRLCLSLAMTFGCVEPLPVASRRVGHTFRRATLPRVSRTHYKRKSESPPLESEPSLSNLTSASYMFFAMSFEQREEDFSVMDGFPYTFREELSNPDTHETFYQAYASNVAMESMLDNASGMAST